jgi:hypothetical protein
MDISNLGNLNIYRYQCYNDGSYIFVWISKCPYCGLDNSIYLERGGYYDRLYDHLRRIDPDFDDIMKY